MPAPCAEYKCSCQPHVLSTSVHASPCGEYKCLCQPVCGIQVFVPARVMQASAFGTGVCQVRVLGIWTRLVGVPK